MTHLWEIAHPYHCAEEHYFGTGSQGRLLEQFASWAAFLAEWEGG